MRFLGLIGAGIAVASLGLADAASAACTRLAFSVNDYGKDGPTKDAKNLLDKYIAKWTADRGIKGYKVGPKTVTCELFLNLIVFDEHTCKAEASVCWSGSTPAGAVNAKAAPAAAKPPAKSTDAARAVPAKVQKTAVPKAAPAAAPIATGSVTPKSKPKSPPAAVQ